LQILALLKGLCRKIFDLWFFSSNNSIWGTDHHKSLFHSQISPQMQSHMQKVRVSGAQIELFDEKPIGRKSRDRVPLTTTTAGH
jgi:hypothetical protein